MSEQEDWQIEMVVAAGSKDNSELLEKISQYKLKYPEDTATTGYWRAFVESRLGNRAKAIEIYSDVIAHEIQACSICRMSRADAYILTGQFALAMADLQTCLEDKIPLVVERFHTSLKYRKALLLAALGDPAFTLAVNEIPPTYSEFILGARRDAAGLCILFRENSGSRGSDK